MSNRRYLTTEQLVERWSGAVAHNTIVNWRGKGEGPPYTKIGHKVLYPIDELENWEAANMRRPNGNAKALATTEGEA